MQNKAFGKDKLVLVYSTDPNIEVLGGGTRYMRYLLKQAIKKGMKVKFIGVKLGNYSKNPTDYTFIPLVKNTDTWWRYFIMSLIKVPFLKLEPDEVIHAQRLLYLLPYVIFHPKNPKICTSDQPLVAASERYPKPVFCILSKLFSRIERYIIKNIDAIVAQERVLKDYYASRYPFLHRKLRYDVNPAAGVDTDLFRPLENREEIRKSLGILPEEKVMLFVGRLAPVKRVDFLIDSLIELRKSIPSSKFLIVGRGESEEMLKKHVAKYKNCPVDFLGEKRGSDLVAIYNCADVLVLASETEGNPTVVREALACGVPVVSTMVGDVGAIINDQYIGKVVPTDISPEGFSNAISEVIMKDKSKVKETCRAKALNFSEDATFDDTYNLYLSLATRL